MQKHQQVLLDKNLKGCQQMSNAGKGTILDQVWQKSLL